MKVSELIKYLEKYDKDTEVLCRHSHASLDIYGVRNENGKAYLECDWDFLKHDS